jgi:hypothetical protein
MRLTRLLIAAMATIVLGAAPGAVVLDGSFSTTVIKPDFTGSTCPANVDGDECGVIQFPGLGPADFVYVFGPTFQPNGTMDCFEVDGTFTIMLQSNGSTMSGPLTGVFCVPGGSFREGVPHSYGAPFSEHDTVELAHGTSQFVGLHGTADFRQFSTGALIRGTLTGTLTG